LNVVKASAKRTHKGFQKIQPLLNKVKPIVNPRNALFGFLVMSLPQPSAALAALGAYGCAGGAYICHSVGWHTKGWKCISGSAACTGYVIGAHRAAPHDPTITASHVTF